MEKNNSDKFNVLRKIANEPKATQRDLAKSLNISVGKEN
jgi:predicted transcriptional regulator